LKVDVENCPTCGAKNSKFVQQCYRCKAELPWSPNYKAPAPNATPAVAPPPASSPTPTVTLPPTNPAPTPANQPAPSLPPAVADSLKRVPAKVEAPTWGLIAIGGGILFLGMGIMAVVMNGRRTQPVLIATPTPMVSAVSTAVPAGATPASGQTPIATGATAPTGTPVPDGTASATATGASTPAAPSPTAVPRLGPSFSDAAAKLEKATGSTQAQKQAYWQSIQGTQVAWTGEVVEADSNNGGKLSLRCAPDAKGTDVQVKLDGSQTGMLASLGKGKKVTVQGILQDHSGTGYVLANGRIVGQG
jgi:hypothetical protein